MEQVIPAPHREIVLEPSRGWLRIEWRELWEYRDLLVLLVRRDFLAFSKGLEGFAQFLNLVAGIALLIQSFKVRRMLTEHLASLGQARPISGVATFFFQILYLQHKINQVLARSTGAGSR